MAGTVAETVAGTERFIFQFDFTERLRRVRCLPESLTGGTRSNGGRLADGGGVPMFAGIRRRNQGGGRLAGIGAGLADAFRRLETGLQGRGTAGRARIRPARADATAGVYAAFPAMVADGRRNQGANGGRLADGGAGLAGESLPALQTVENGLQNARRISDGRGHGTDGGRLARAFSARFRRWWRIRRRNQGATRARLAG